MPKGIGSDTLMLLGGLSLTLVFVYIALCLYALSRADALIFPRVTPSYSDGSEMIRIPLKSGQQIAAIHLSNPQARQTIFYSHGNGEDLGHILPLLQQYAARGYSVFAYDYPGYGLSDGTASSSSVIDASEAALKHLIEQIGAPVESIILYGRSVGGGPSTWLAARYPVGGMVIESGFTSAFRVLTRYKVLLWDRLPNLQWIGDAKCPVLIIHGTEDQIVGFWHGNALLEAAPDPKYFLWVQGAGHNNIIGHAGKAYWDALTTFSATAIDTQRNTSKAI